MPNPCRQLRDWQRAAPGRKVYWGALLVAMADGTCSAFAVGTSTRDAAKRLLEAWGAPPVGQMELFDGRAA